MFLISFSARATDEEWENFCVMKKSRPARSCAREFWKFTFPSATGSTQIQISPPILTCSKLWHDCERARERQDERNGVRGWRNSTVKWHWSRRRTPKKKLSFSYTTRAIEQTLCTFHHIVVVSLALSAAIISTTGMPLATEHERREGREMITNYFDISFCSVSFSFFYLNSILLCAVLWHFWIGFMVAKAMLLISWASRMPFTFTTLARTRNHFYRISHTEIVKPSRIHFKLHFFLAHFATLSQFTLLSSVVNWSEGKEDDVDSNSTFYQDFYHRFESQTRTFAHFHSLSSLGK